MRERICSEPECDRRERCRGLCAYHYGRAHRSGTLEIRLPKPLRLAGPGELTCSLPGCRRRQYCRTFCAHHYGKLWRRGEIGARQLSLPFDVHSLSNVDLELRTGHCSICGPNARIRRRSRGGAECEQKPSRARRGQLSRNPLTRRQQSLRKKYGLTEDGYELLRASQAGACAICKETPDYRLHVDHCHVTGRVRGLLCQNCNVGLGFLRDDTELLRRAITYLTLDTEGAVQVPARRPAPP